jgi:hypothetical protein
MRAVVVVVLMAALAGMLLSSGCPPSSTTQTPPTGAAGSTGGKAAGATSVTAGTVTPLGPELAAAKALWERKCTRCHTLARVGKHDASKEPWPDLVASMRAKKPGWITDADMAQIVKYLEYAFPARAASPAKG